MRAGLACLEYDLKMASITMLKLNRKYYIKLTVN